jgi:cytochrome c oxidase assembly protein subunit 15
MDLAAQAHPILRLRMAHPLMALSLGGGMVLYFWLQAQKAISTAAKKIYLQTALGIAVALVFGFLTLILLSPTWMKLAHLGLAHVLWALLLRLWLLVAQEKSMD